MTTIEDTLTYADGGLANGRAVINTPAFTFNGAAVAASQTIVDIVEGSLAVTLYPNMTAQPAGVYYTVAYELEEGPVYTEYWIVPDHPQVNLGQVRASFPLSPSVMINAQQLTSAGASSGQFLGWNGANWVPMYVTSFNYYPNFIGMDLTDTTAPDLSVTGSPASLGSNFTLNVPDAGPASRGVVNTGAQTFAGDKTFSGNVTSNGQITAPTGVFTDLTATDLHVTGGGNVLIDPTTTLGDLIVRGASATQRFGVGGNGQVLTADSTQPLGVRWQTPTGAVSSVFGRTGAVIAQTGDYTVSQVSGALADPTTTTGDLIARGVSAVGRLPVGLNGQVLTADSTQPLGVGWATSLVSSVFGRTGAVTAQAGDYAAVQVTNAVDQTQTYANPSWIASLAWPKITGAPAVGVSSVFGRTGAVVAAAGDYAAEQVTNAVDATQTYNNPAWIATLAWSKITGAPATGVSSFNGRTGAVVPATGDYSVGQVTGAVANTTQITAGTGLAGGGPLTGNVPLSVVNDTTTQRVRTLNDGSLITTRAGVNFIAGNNVSISITDDATYNAADVLISSTGGSGGMVDPTTTLGDLIVRGSAAVERLAVGTTGQVLTADSTQPLGVKWAAAAGGGAVSSVFGRTGAVVAAAGDYAAAEVTNAVDSTQTYSNPAWLTSLAWSKITGAPATGVSSFNARTGAILPASGDYTAAMVTNAVDSTQTYSNPAWIGSLAWSKITGAPAVGVSSVFGRTGAVTAASGDYSAFYTPLTRNINTGTGLSGGGALSADLTLVGLVFHASGVSHSSGDVPDPGATAGATRFLREDATWSVPAGGTVSPLNTKGDIWAYSTTDIRLPVGADNFALLANSAQTIGLQWTAIANSFNGRTGAVVPASGDYTAAQVTNAVSTTGAYSDPAWLTGLSWSKILGAPAFGPTASYYVNGGYIAQQPALNLIPGSGTTISGINNTASSRVDVTVTATASAQTPWTQNINAAGFNLTQVGSPLAVGNTGATLPDATTTDIHLIVGPTASSAAAGEVTVCGNSSTSGATAGLLNFANYANTGTEKRVAAVSVILDGAVNSGAMLFNTWSAGSLAERMRITSAGLVGINNAAPAYKLDISGDCNITGTYRVNGSPLTIFWQAGSGGAIYYNGGYVGIGTSSPAGLLHLSAPSGNAMLRIQTASGSNAPYVDFLGGSQEWILGSGIGSANDFYLWDQNRTAAVIMAKAGSGNVGIGTSSPATSLHLAIASSSLAEALRLDNTTNTSSNGSLITWANAAQAYLAGSLGFVRNGAGAQQDLVFNLTSDWTTTAPAEKVRFAGNGNVGIGTSSPNGKLQIGAAAATGYATYGGSLIINEYSTSLNAVMGIEFLTRGDSSGFGWRLSSLANNVDFVFESRSGSPTWTERMRILNNGNVGIGTASPQTCLDVQSAANGGPGGNGIIFFKGGSGQGTLYADSTNVGFGSITNNPLIFYTNNGAIQMTLTTAGNLGIGVSPSYRLHVSGDCNITGTYRVNGTPIATGIAGLVGYYGAGTGPYGGNGYNGILMTGGANITATCQNSSVGGVSCLQFNIAYAASDPRLKQNVAALDGGLSIIDRIRPISAEWNGLLGKPKGERLASVNAQELKEIIPYAVSTFKARLRPEDEEEADVLSYDPAAIVMHCVLAIQQLSKRVDELEKKHGVDLR